MLQHTLIVGTTGSGKSYLEKTIIDRLMAKHSARFAFVDPKRSVLRHYRNSPDTIAYADNPREYFDTIVRVYDQMNMRFAKMARECDETGEPMEDYDGIPIYLVVDEAAMLLADRKNARHFLGMLGEIACAGRAERVFIIWCTQVPTKENVPNIIRDNLDSIVALRLRDQGKARFAMGCEPEGGFRRLPRYGQGYVLTPDFIDGPRRMDVGDGMLRALGM